MSAQSTARNVEKPKHNLRLCRSRPYTCIVLEIVHCFQKMEERKRKRESVNTSESLTIVTKLIVSLEQGKHCAPRVETGMMWNNVVGR